MSPTERFVAKVDKTGSCWVWTAYRTARGYGRFNDGSRIVQTHRFAYELWVGPIPDGLELDHLCRNRSCVNPDHLEPVTGRENILRGVSPSAQHAAKTHCPNGHPYSGENLYVAPGRHHRQCRACISLSNARRVR